MIEQCSIIKYNIIIITKWFQFFIFQFFIYFDVIDDNMNDINLKNINEMDIIAPKRILINLLLGLKNDKGNIIGIVMIFIIIFCFLIGS